MNTCSGIELFIRFTVRVLRGCLSVCECASFPFGGWSGGAMVLGELPVPGRLTGLD